MDNNIAVKNYKTYNIPFLWWNIEIEIDLDIWGKK